MADFTDTSGGLAQNVSPFKIQPNASPDARNIELDSELGAFSKAPGYAQYGSDAGNNAIQGLFGFERPDGTTQLFMASNGVYYEDVSLTWTSRDTGNHTTNKVEGAQLYDKLFVTDYDSAPQYTSDGTTWTAIADADFTGDGDCKFVVAYRNRLYALNFNGSGTALKNGFRWSDLGDGTAWTSTNYSNDIEDPITGAGATFNYLYIFTEKAFYRFDESYLVKVDQVGCSSHRSIAFGDGYIFWANRGGIYASTGGKPQWISRPVQDWFDGIAAGNWDDLNGAFDPVNHDYWLWIGTSQGVSDVCLIFNTQQQRWRMKSGVPSAVMTVWTNSSGDRNLYFGNNTADSLVYKVGGTVQQAAANVTSQYDYPQEMPGGEKNDFHGGVLRCAAKASGAVTFDINYALDFDDTFVTLTSWQLQGTGNTELFDYEVPSDLVKGRAIQWQVSESGSVDYTWERLKYEPEVRGGKVERK